MKFIHIIFYSCFILLLAGCGSSYSLEPENNDQDQPIELTKISSNQGYDQHVANRAKERVSKHEEIASVKAINTEQQLLIAVEVNQFDRFGLKEIREKLKREVKTEFPDLKVIISTDKKIFLELDQLEQDLLNKKIDKKTLNKRFNEVMKLEKEQT